MKKIVLMCSNGMSTSLMVAKMREAAAKEYARTYNRLKGRKQRGTISTDEWNHIVAVAEELRAAGARVELFQADVGDADCILIGPQVKHKLPQVQKDCPDVPVAAIEMKDYGMMNGAAVLKAARKLMGEEV